MDKRERPKIKYPKELDNMTWKEYNRKHNGDVPKPSAEFTKKTHEDEPSEFMSFVLTQRENITDARLAESDEDCCCDHCGGNIYANSIHLRLKLKEESRVKTYCNICYT